jgi:DNA polymerase-3 subunit delta'
MDTMGHPDFWQISVADTSKKEITIDQIREDILEGLSYHPFEGNRRVILISDAHKMNPAAANALLKALEEPPTGTYFVLTTISASALLSTIRSRCQKLRFVPFAGDALEEFWTKTQPDLSVEDLRIVSALSIQRDVQEETDSSVQTILNRVLFLANRLVEISSLPIQQKLALAEYLGISREQAIKDIDIWVHLLRDVAIQSIDAEKIEIQPVAKILKPLTKVSPNYLFQATDALLSAKRQIMGNTSPRLCFEKLFLSLSNVLSAPIANK